MHNEISTITNSLFQKASLPEVGTRSIEETIAKYPYYAPARLLLAQRSFENEGEAAEAIITAGLFLHNPLRLDWLLRHEEKNDTAAELMPGFPNASDVDVEPSAKPDTYPSGQEASQPAPSAAAPHGESQALGQYFLENLDEVTTEEEDTDDAPLQEDPPQEPPPVQEQQAQSPSTAEPKPAQPVADSPITFQSYHTIDYFASQGIRLQQAELAKDKLGQQLKSFTEWLRSMKKLPATESELPPVYDTMRHNSVMQSAAHSIEAREIFTEAMAQVWAKQGNNDKAITIYEKLSLQNPAKSDYFAAKIDQLKAL